MANTYSQVHIHCVFAVQNRASLIHAAWKDHLYAYIAGIVKNQGHKLLSIGGVENHIHLLAGLRPSQSISDFMQDIKGDSSKWINQQGFVRGRFSWQAGFGVFSYRKRDIPLVAGYIERQEEHHLRTSFRQEYIKMLEEFGVDYDDRYIFLDVD